MKAIKIEQPRQITVVDIDEPQMGHDDVLLKIEYVGFCGSDLNTWRGRNLLAKNPVVPGHEVSAIVEAIGEDVPATSGLCIGQRVTVNPYSACGHCASCRNNRPNACENNQTLGVQRDGAMQERLAINWQKVIPVGDLDARHVALIEPLSVGFHAVSRAQVTANDRVLVIGCGIVGLGAVLAAACRGAQVEVCDLDKDKIAVANEMIQNVRSIGRPEGQSIDTPKRPDAFDVVIEAVGAAATYRMAVESVDFTGRIVCIGYAPADIPLPTNLFVKKELDVRGSRNALPADFEAVIQALQSGAVPCDRFISRIIQPAEAAEALEQWDAAPGRVFRILTNFSKQ